MKKLLSIVFAALAITALTTSCCNCDKECCKKGDKKECTNEFKKEHSKHHGRPDLASEQECGVERKKCNPEMKEMFEKWMNSEYIEIDADGWHLKENAPKEIKEKYDEFIKMTEMAHIIN